MSLVGRYFPHAAEINHFDPEATARLAERLNFDGTITILTVSLSYAGFILVSIKEGRRYGRTQLEKASLETEMAAAHEVQSVLVPEALPAIPGYAIQSIYHPAAQVGGDFFQIIPLPNGSTLIAIGDVSGKGLRAAMIVSLIIGALRTLCTVTDHPAIILAELNRQLLGRVHGGFVTCLLIRIDANDPDAPNDRGGSLLLANAGHLPPYRNGIEIPVPGSLPLGLTEDAIYDAMPLELATGDSLVLLTDGVAEAQNATQQIFGFERVELVLQSRANLAELAEAARLHGQNDDITLLSVTRS
jgi:serine phosphatase RsbU (regulator of sigma subunit)